MKIKLTKRVSTLLVATTLGIGATLSPINTIATNNVYASTIVGTSINAIKLNETYTASSQFSNGLALVHNQNNKCGYINTKGELVIPFNYDYGSYSFSDGLAAVSQNGKYGFIDTTGQQVIPFEYDEAGSFSNGIAFVNKNGKIGAINKNGIAVSPFIYDLAWQFQDGVSFVAKDGKVGGIDISGNEVIPFIYDSANNFSDGLAIVMKDGQCGYINTSGQEVIPFQYNNGGDFSSGIAGVLRGDKCGFINTSGQEVIPFIYDNFRNVSEGLIAVQKNGKWGYIDTTGKEVIPFIYDVVGSFSEGLAVVMSNNQYAYINTAGEVVIPFAVGDCVDYQDGNVLVRRSENGSLVSYIIPNPLLSQAKPTPSAVFVNGVKTEFDAYKINDNNYFKLRDLAYIFNGTDKQFEVSWNESSKTIALTTGQGYTAVGGEMSAPSTTAKSYSKSNSSLLVNGQSVNLEAYSINFNTYFKLRDICELLGIEVTWDAATNNIGINS